MIESDRLSDKSHNVQTQLDELTFILSQDNEIVILVGSGISIWKPTNLPLGVDISMGIYRALFIDDLGKSIIPDDEFFKIIYRDIPFEVITDKCPKRNVLNHLLLRIFQNVQPNPIHQLIAKLLVEGRISTIITTNYDCALDRAISETYVSKKPDVKVIVRDESVDGFSSDKILFKIHGSTDDGDGSTLVFQLSQEGILPDWKKHILHSSLKDKTLLVIGYSGRDFEICPEIPLARPNKIVWNFYKPEDITPNAYWVAEKIREERGDGSFFFLCCDMREMLSKVFTPITATLSANSFDLENLCRESFSALDRELWRIRVLNSINYNRAVLRETNKLLKDDSLDKILRIGILNEHAEALQSYGLYKQSARTREKIAQTIKELGLSLNDNLRQLLAASDMWRCYGNFIFAVYRHKQVEKAIHRLPAQQEMLFTAILRNKILLLRELYRFFKYLGLRPISNLIQKRAAEIISEAVEIVHKNADWYSFQQMQLLADRFDISDETTSMLKKKSLPVREGYQQLNFRMGRMMAFRDMVQSGKLPPDETVFSEAAKLSREAMMLGIRPEVWKLELIILLRFKKQRSLKNLKQFLDAFLSCEYSFLRRIWLLIMGG